VQKRNISLLLLVGLVFGCNQTKFASQNNQQNQEPPAPPKEEPKEEPKTPEPPKCDLSKDFVSLKFPANIQTCVDAGNIYDFYRNTCSPVKKATSYDCSFAGVKARAAALNLDYSGVDKAIADNAKLIGCGEKRDGLTLVTEWWHPNNAGAPGDCTFSPESIITVTCFQKENGDGTVVDAPTIEARREIIKKCLE
jgi:hypothetical protein